jgi:hypothetical protein
LGRDEASEGAIRPAAHPGQESQGLGTATEEPSARSGCGRHARVVLSPWGSFPRAAGPAQATHGPLGGPVGAGGPSPTHYSESHRLVGCFCHLPRGAGPAKPIGIGRHEPAKTANPACMRRCSAQPNRVQFGVRSLLTLSNRNCRDQGTRCGKVSRPCHAADRRSPAGRPAVQLTAGSGDPRRTLASSSRRGLETRAVPSLTAGSGDPRRSLTNSKSESYSRPIP